MKENLSENYGTITLEQVIKSELQHINEQGREAQDTYYMLLYKSLMASLLNTAKKKISLWSEQYRISDNEDLCSGVELLKIIIRESHLDTNATTNQILSNLDNYILTVDSDIGKFNQYVKLLIQSLTARNQKTSDLLINLFKGYCAVSDEVFRAWLVRKQDNHEEGEELTPDDLMIAVKTKFDTMVEKGTWNAPTAEEKIVALEAKFKSTMKLLNKKVTFESSKKKAAKSGGGKHGSTKNDADHPKKWKAPKQGDKKEVEFKGHTWYWCGKDTGRKCEKWRAHKPKECKGLATMEAAGDKRKKDSTRLGKKKSIEKKHKIAKAYIARMEQAAEKDATSEDSK